MRLYNLSRFLLFTASAILFISPVLGQAPIDAALLRQMLDRIDKLEKRVNELEAEKLAAAPKPFATPVETAAIKPGAMPDHVMGQDVSGTPAGSASFPSLHIAGFSDINFQATDRKGATSGFNEGQFILHLSSALSSRVTYFGELSITARTDAGIGSPPATGFNVEVERSIIRFDQNDHLKVSFGRYHTPINFWNTAFHHGSWLQTTISRPEMVEFGGSLIPVHFIGAQAEGTFALNGLNLHYNSGIGNGRGTVISRGGDFGDINNNRAWLFNVFAQPDHPYGLRFGASVYRDKINPIIAPAAREWIQSAHIVWQKENPELIAEFSNITHTGIGGNTQFNSQAWYVQAAYRIPLGDNKWKPYYRFEYIHIPRGDKIFAAVSSLAGSSAGIRYDLTSFAALKFEYRRQRRPGIPQVNGLFAQTSFTF